PAFGVDDAEAAVDAAERAQDAVEIGLLANERPGCAPLGIPRRIDGRDARRAVGRIDVDQADAERGAGEAQRNADLDRKALGRLLPETLDAVLVNVGRREPRRARASRTKRARPAGAEQESAA